MCENVYTVASVLGQIMGFAHLKQTYSEVRHQHSLGSVQIIELTHQMNVDLLQMLTLDDSLVTARNLKI